MERGLFFLISEVHLMPLDQTKPSLQLLSVSDCLGPQTPPSNTTPLPLLALTVKQSSLEHDWQSWEPITHLEQRTALLAIISAVSSEAETWAVSIPAASLFLSSLLPSTDKDAAKAKRWSLSPFHVLNLWQKPHIIANMWWASITVTSALLWDRTLQQIVHWF